MKASSLLFMHNKLNDSKSKINFNYSNLSTNCNEYDTKSSKKIIRNVLPIKCKDIKNKSLEIQIRRVKMNKMQINERLKEAKKEKFERKQIKLKENKMRLNIQKQQRREIKSKQNELRKIRLKLFNIFSDENHHICDEFERKNTSYNIKLYDFLGGTFSIRKALQYHSHFRFDKHNNGEAHDRSQMFQDIPKIKKEYTISNKELLNQFTENEKIIIFNDPDYFAKVSTSKVTPILKKVPLSQRLQEEEELNIPLLPSTGAKLEMLRITRREKEKKHQIEEEVGNKIKEIDNMINKVVYDKRTLRLKKENDKNKKIGISEYYNKAIKDMMFKSFKVARSLTEKKKGIAKGIGEKKKKVIRLQGFRMIKLNNGDDFTLTEKDEGFGNGVFGNNNFTKAESEYVNKLNQKIKEGLTHEKV